MPQSKTARWLDLIAYLLQHHYPVTREQIYEHVTDYRESLGPGAAPSESVRRKFERDKDELRALGIDIQTVEVPNQAGDEPASGYRMAARDFYLPYLELTRAASAPRPYQRLASVTVSQTDLAILDRATRRLADRADFPLSAAAASARRKLAFDLPLSIKSVEHVLLRPLTGESAKSLEVLQRAVADRTAVRCRYFAIGRDSEETRVIEPYGLFFNWSHWYTAARARDRNAMRVFRADRMREAELLTGPKASFTVPAEFRVAAYVRRSPWELTEQPPTAVRVRFEFPESRWVMAREVGKPIEELLDDGGAVIEFAVRERGPFLRWLLTFRDHVAVESPPSFAEELETLRRKVAQLYAGRAS